MEKNNRPLFRDRAAAFGFTLIETVIAVSLFSVAAVTAYASFRNGWVAYQRIEAALGQGYEVKMFARQINEELRNAVPFAEQPFEGESDRMMFVTRLARFENDRMVESLYRISYRFSSPSLERTEQKLRDSFLGSEARESKETLLELDTCRFQFAYRKRSGGLDWRNEWAKQPYLGNPRGIRLAIKSKSTGRQKGSAEEKTYFILIPQGTLGVVL